VNLELYPEEAPMPESESDGHGMTPLELLALSPLQRLIVRLLLRAGELPYATLVSAAQEQGRAAEAEALDAALRFLCDQQWVALGADPSGPTYRVNVRQRPPNRGRTEIWRRVDLGGDGDDGAR
jgi:hypothetical protein